MKSRNNKDKHYLAQINDPFAHAITMIEQGSNPNLINAYGESILHILNKSEINVNGRYDSTIEDLIKKHHANLNILNTQGQTPLQCILNKIPLNLQAAFKLIRLGAEPNSNNDNGNTLLHMLAQSDKDQEAEMKELVAELHADIHTKNSQGLSPLQLLILKRDFHIENAMTLVRLGADPNSINQDGKSLLHILSQSDNNNSNAAYLTELVIIFHADIHIQDAQGRTPLEALMHHSFYTKTAMTLLGLGADPDSKDQHGNSLLHIFSLSKYDKDAEIIELVTKFHADIHIKNAQGYTPLQALMNNKLYVKTTMILIRLGADPNSKDKNGRSLLHLFSFSENDRDAEIIELVTKFHVDIDIKNAKGWTPLQSMINDLITKSLMKHYINRILLLIHLGADVDTIFNGTSLYQHLTSTLANNECKNELQEIYALTEDGQKKYQAQRTNFLNVLIVLACNDRSPNSIGPFPLEIMAHIMGFVGEQIPNKTGQESYLLAKTIFSSPQQIREMAQSPGGINVLQQINKQSNQPTFTLFKSAQIFALDYQKLEADLRKKDSSFFKKNRLKANSKNILDNFAQEYAITIWKNQTQLYQRGRNQQKLLTKIEHLKPYTDPGISDQITQLMVSTYF